MDNKQKVLIQSSFLKIVANSVNVAELFYSNLFEHSPKYRALFKSDPLIQGEKFISMLGFVVNNLYDDSTKDASLIGLAKRHVSYSVAKEDYLVVGEVLMKSLQEGLEEKFTDEVKEAWKQLYAELSCTMIEAAYSPLPGKP